MTPARRRSAVPRVIGRRRVVEAAHQLSSVGCGEAGNLVATAQAHNVRLSGILDISAVDLDRMQVNQEAILDSWQRDGILLARPGTPTVSKRVEMTARAQSRTTTCSSQQAGQRLRQAEGFLGWAQRAMADKGDETHHPEFEKV